MDDMKKSRAFVSRHGYQKGEEKEELAFRFCGTVRRVSFSISQTLSAAVPVSESRSS